MRIYDIAPLTVALPDLTGRVFAPENEPFCQDRAYAPIDCYPWSDNGYMPEGRAYVAHRDGALHVLLCVKEKEIIVREHTPDGDVYMDSCAEFFFRPFSDDPRYINIEVNAHGVPLVGFGKGREPRIRLHTYPHITHSEHDGAWWAIAYTVSADMIETLYGRKLPDCGTMLGNFQHCDEVRPCFGSWNPIEAPAPDFHRPECFGTLNLL